MVVYEAARSMVNLKNVTAREVQPAVSGTRTYAVYVLASSPRPLKMGLVSTAYACANRSQIQVRITCIRLSKRKWHLRILVQ